MSAQSDRPARGHFFKRNLLPISVALALAAGILNTVPQVHDAVINVDVAVSLWANGLLGQSVAFDKLVGFLNTRVGDLCVVSVLSSMLAIGALQAKTPRARVYGLAYWAWVGVVTIVMYLLSCFSDYFISRPIPLSALSQMTNVATKYGFHLHTLATNSFPSGHGFAYIFFTAMAFRHYKRMAPILMAIAMVMVSMRVVIGVHWLSDIAVGSVIMMLFTKALACNTILAKTYKLACQMLLAVIQFINSIAAKAPNPVSKLWLQTFSQAH